MPKLMFYYKTRIVYFLARSSFLYQAFGVNRPCGSTVPMGRHTESSQLLSKYLNRPSIFRKYTTDQVYCRFKKKSLNKQNLCLICTDISCNPLLSAFFKMFTVCLCVWEPQGKSECNGFFIVQS